MELFEEKDYYIIRNGDHALWCSRIDGSFSARTGKLTIALEPSPITKLAKATIGAVHKVRHARGGEDPEIVWQFVTGGGGQEHVTSRL